MVSCAPIMPFAVSISVHEALMLSEVDVRDKSDNIVFVVRVLVHEELEQLALLFGELMIDLRVSVDLNSDFAPSHMVDC